MSKPLENYTMRELRLEVETLREKQRLALKRAMLPIYFADNSDYLTGLWEVVDELDKNAYKLLQEDERKAVVEYCDVED